MFSAGERRFVTPYYVLLNHPEIDSDALKVHKHTVPPFIPIEQLSARYLPLPDPAAPPSDQRTKQNLPAFVRDLRRELVSHNKRLAALQTLKAGLSSKNIGKILDPSGKGFEMELSDGSVARLALSRGGEIESAIVRARTHGDESSAAGQRQRGTERAILGGNGRIDELLNRLAQHDVL
jgi:central kinetochore subunit Mal2/MCM21